MLDSHARHIFARVRCLALAAAAAAAADVPAAKPTSIVPTRPVKPYKPDLSRVPPGVLQALQRAINSIEEHDRTATPLVRPKSLRSIAPTVSASACHPGDTSR